MHGDILERLLAVLVEVGACVPLHAPGAVGQQQVVVGSGLGKVGMLGRLDADEVHSNLSHVAHPTKCQARLAVDLLVGGQGVVIVEVVAHHAPALIVVVRARLDAHDVAVEDGQHVCGDVLGETRAHRVRICYKLFTNETSLHSTVRSEKKVDAGLACKRK